MQKFHILNKQSYSKTRQKNKISLTKAIIWAFFSIGSIALLTSLVYVSSILAFIGLGLVFWGAILLYIQPEQYVKKAILDATVTPLVATLNQIIQELNYKGNAIYLPPKYLKNPDASKVYISKQKDGKLPEYELILKHENQLFFENPQGILLTPPGASLSKLFEKRLVTSFAKTDLKYVIQNMPKLFIEDLEIAENIEIETEYNTIKIRITNPTFKEAEKGNNNLSDSYHSLACPLLSAIACALTKATGKPITIEHNQLSNDGKTIEATYQILGIIETETYLPTIRSEKFLTEPINIQIRKSLLPNLASLLLTVIGSILLVQVAWVSLTDVTIWGKDIAQIFLDPRTGETISLGIGMKIIYYFLIGLASFFSGVFTYLRRRNRV